MLSLKQKADEIIGKLNQLVNAGPNEFELAKIKAETKKIENAGFYTEAQQIYGMLATIKGNVADTHKHFKSALAHSGQNKLILLNYIISLGNIHQYSDAVKLSESIIDGFPDDINALKQLVNIFHIAFEIDDVKLILDKLLALGVSENDPIIKLGMVSLDEKERLLEASGSSTKEICDRISTVSEVITSFGVMSTGINESFCDDCILYEFVCKTTEEKLVDIDSAITKKLAELPYLATDSLITFSCTVENKQ